MELQKAIDAVNAKFKYEKDEGIDRWEVMGSDMRGDCEDYALTIAKLHSEKWTTFFWRLFGNQYYKIWYVKTKSGAGHAVLEVEGQFIDNFYRKLVPEMNIHKFYFYYPRTLLVGKLFWSLILGGVDALRRTWKNRIQKKR